MEAESQEPQELSGVQKCMIPLSPPPTPSLQQDSAGEHTTGAWRWSRSSKTRARGRCLDELFQEEEALSQVKGSGLQEGQGESGATWVLPTAGLGLDAGSIGTTVLSGSLLLIWHCRPTEPKVSLS